MKYPMIRDVLSGIGFYFSPHFSNAGIKHCFSDFNLIPLKKFQQFLRKGHGHQRFSVIFIAAAQDDLARGQLNNFKKRR